MRILPSMQTNRNFVNGRNITYKTKLDRSNVNNLNNQRQAHRYTGVASSDLAYASLFDSSIAKDLKIMGLI